jgi:HD superfamily phosphohydrolase
MSEDETCPRCGAKFAKEETIWHCQKCSYQIPYDPKVEEWMAKVEGKYGKKRAAQFQEDRGLLRVYLAMLKEELGKRGYTIEEPLGTGGTGIVFKVSHPNQPHGLVVKFNRPKLPEEELSIIQNEKDILPKLNHHNIIRIIESGQISTNLSPPRKLTYIIEPYISDPRTISEYVAYRLDSAKNRGIEGINSVLLELVQVLRQWVTAFDYIHSEEYVYLDVKPSNALIDNGGSLVVIDFGSARQYDKETAKEIDTYDRYEETGYFDAFSDNSGPIKGDENAVRVFFTKEYAHPFLQKLSLDKTSTQRVKAGIKKKFLHPRFDLYALGKSILELLNLISAVEESQIPNLRPFRYLHLLATRLLDGANETESTGVAIEIFGDLRKSDYRSIKYLSLRTVLQDLDKETGNWNPQIEIPELGSYSQAMLRVGNNLNIALTDRLLDIIRHPLFARLKLTTELGLISFIYPTADHTRFDHILGTYANTVSYVNSLYNDDQNPIFRNLVDAQDLKATLLAALLHDLGQYPLAHDLEEVSLDIFDHARLSIELIRDPMPDLTKKENENRTLMQIIENEWKVEVNWLEDILGAKRPATLIAEEKKDKTRIFKMDMLSALIDGPIDADKADYVMRDSNECGIPYGDQVDKERLTQVLTVALNPKEASAHRVTVGVYAKGRASAESLGLARYLMFSAVYWHHTSRIVKAMLQYATALLLIPAGVMEETDTKVIRQTKNTIRADLRSFAKSLIPPFEKISSEGRVPIRTRGGETSLLGRPAEKATKVIEEYISTSQQESIQDIWYPGIDWTDWLMLRWLKREICKGLTKYTRDQRAVLLLDSLMGRKLYKRVATIPNEGEGSLPHKLVKMSWSRKIALSSDLQQRIKKEVLRTWDDLSTSSWDTSKEEAERLFDEQLCILIDIPDPESKLGYTYGRPLFFVPELKQRTYYQEADEPPQEGKNVLETWRSIAPLRVLCHPTLLQPVSKAMFPAYRQITDLLTEIIR